MNYFELNRISNGTKLLSWKERSRSFSEGVFILSKYMTSDFPNLHVVQQSKADPGHIQILYGDITEILENGLTEEDAKRLFELGWSVDGGLNVEDNYFKFIL